MRDLTWISKAASAVPKEFIIGCSLFMGGALIMGDDEELGLVLSMEVGGKGCVSFMEEEKDECYIF